MHSTAEALRDDGQQLALFRAGPAWVESALAALDRYIDSRRRLNAEEEFTFEQFRVWATTMGLVSEPPSLNAWGALARTAQSRKVIEYTGRVREARRAASHARLIRIWRAA